MRAYEEMGASALNVKMRLGVKIPLRDGVLLNANLYLPQRVAPAIVTLLPYGAQMYHDVGMRFASAGFPFLSVDVRGRGDSEGVFEPNINEAGDAHDVVEWIARQPFCNNKVAMWGGSYMGYTQWAAAREAPPHLATIVPVAAPYFGVDFPWRNNIPTPYAIRWLTFVAGRTSQDKIFGDQAFWTCKFRENVQSGLPFAQLDSLVGHPSQVFQTWLEHPERGLYWDRYNPTAEQYARIDIPVLTITGAYDGDQPGALTHYREHLKRNQGARERHYLVIGPWDHAGTRTPKEEFCGIRAGPASLVDLHALHVQWYEWTMGGGPEPAFLQNKVAYYVLGADEWRYADTLEQVTERLEPLYLGSCGDATDVFRSGVLTASGPIGEAADHFIYDPRDTTLSELESTVDPANFADQRMVLAAAGRQLVYHTAALERDVDIAGFFRLTAWLSIDQPDTDFSVTVFEIALDGSSVAITNDAMRARYRETPAEPRLIGTLDPLQYHFESFMFAARRVRKGHRLRLVIGPVNSIYRQRNYNSGGIVAHESKLDARPVMVRLFHDDRHRSVLHVPIAAQFSRARQQR